MGKKKILKIVLLIALLLIVVFLICTVRKMLIIKDLNENVSKYLNEDNYYEKIINNSGSTTTVTEYYSKGDKAVLFLNTTLNSSGEIRKLTNYYNGEKTNTYIESSGDKIALLDSNGLPSKLMIIGLDYNDNMWQLFQMALAISIKDGEYNGKECYIIRLGEDSESYIEKETGLRVKAKEGFSVDENGNKSPILVEYYYEFGNVNDNIFIEPDISEYTVQENN